MNVAVGTDHGGFSIKHAVIDELKKIGHTVIDCGAMAYDAGDDYPDYARAVGETIQRGVAARGIVICGSGVGVTIMANKMRGIRACLCHDAYSARQGVEHDNMNVLALGGRVIGEELARELVRAFMNAKFDANERFVRRANKITEIENERQ